jgi:hypothetical protein
MVKKNDRIGDILQECIGDRLEPEREAIKAEQQCIAEKFIEKGEDPLVSQMKAWSVVFNTALHDVAMIAKQEEEYNT